MLSPFAVKPAPVNHSLQTGMTYFCLLHLFYESSSNFFHDAVLISSLTQRPYRTRSIYGIDGQFITQRRRMRDAVFLCIEVVISAFPIVRPRMSAIDAAERAPRQLAAQSPPGTCQNQHARASAILLAESRSAFFTADYNDIWRRGATGVKRRDN